MFSFGQDSTFPFAWIKYSVWSKCNWGTRNVVVLSVLNFEFIVDLYYLFLISRRQRLAMSFGALLLMNYTLRIETIVEPAVYNTNTTLANCIVCPQPPKIAVAVKEQQTCSRVLGYRAPNSRESLLLLTLHSITLPTKAIAPAAIIVTYCKPCSPVLTFIDWIPIAVGRSLPFPFSTFFLAGVFTRHGCKANPSSSFQKWHIAPRRCHHTQEEAI